MNLLKPAPSGRYFPLMLLLFVGSGCAALIYEIVWFQLLQLVIGSSAVSLGGVARHLHGRHVSSARCCSALRLARGASAARVREAGGGDRRRWRAARRADAARRPALHGDAAAARRHRAPCGRQRASASAAHAADGRNAAGDRALGGRRRRRASSWLGFFYGGNIAGAVFGCLLAGFYLLRVHDMATATLVGGRDQRRSSRAPACCCRSARRTAASARRARRQQSRRRSRSLRSARGVYVAIALSGLTRARRRSRLDAVAVADARRVGVHVLDHPRGVPDRTRHRQRVGSSRRRGSAANARVALGWVQLLLASRIAWARG